MMTHSRFIEEVLGNIVRNIQNLLEDLARFLDALCFLLVVFISGQQGRTGQTQREP